MNPVLHDILLTVRNTFLFLAEQLFRHFPIEDKIMFSNFYGRGLGDDPKYIYQYLKQIGTNAKLVWVVKNNSINVPEGVIKAPYKSLAYVFHQCTSRVWVCNVKSEYKVKKREGQYYIQTWHATLGLKKVEAEVPSLATDYISISQKDASITDLMYANNDFELNVYKNYFWYNGRVLKCDVPRLGILLNTPKELKKKVYDFFRIPKTKKIIIYAPTFRKNADISVFVWDFEKVIRSFEKRFSCDCIFLLRLHPNLARYASDIKYSERVLNASSYPDMQELIACSDFMINDYSSSMFDMGCTHKPVILYAPDFESYVSNDRGLEFNIEQLPFPLVKNVEDLCDIIETFDNSLYSNKCNEFYHSIGWEDSGHGAEMISKIIINQLNKA